MTQYTNHLSHRSSTAILLSAVALLSSCSINTNDNEHFDKDGHYISNDSTETVFKVSVPKQVNFYIEVSGSMNGFFRANRATEFKTDIWKIVSRYKDNASDVKVLSNDGKQTATIAINQFQTQMNTGAFVSTASTKVPIMLQTIIDNLNDEDVAILVSDMKYSPVGSAAPEALMAQYSTDINNIFNNANKAVSLICATSNYLDKQGSSQCDRSPYYYLVIGKPECVASVRNTISTILEKENHYIDNIEAGFDCGSPQYSFSICNKCDQLYNEPTFINYQEAEPDDTCMVKLKIDLGNYRWIESKEEYFRNSFKAKTTYGSNCKVGKVSIVKSEDISDYKTTATIELFMYNMITDSEVIEWTLDLPNTDYTLMNEFFEGALSESDVSKSFSVKDFVKGMVTGDCASKKLKNNYILFSKNG